MILSAQMENYIPKVSQSKDTVKYQTKLSADYKHKVKRK